MNDINELNDKSKSANETANIINWLGRLSKNSKLRRKFYKDQINMIINRLKSQESDNENLRNNR